ncbi:hypothetical protein, partial [uncultured Roseobacter sp.]|uniref:hypothetical protein n=1 Tax=uncultured Roseobacter sp. TaxID=114847 RepID=UPI002615898E
MTSPSLAFGNSLFVLKRGTVLPNLEPEKILMAAMLYRSLFTALKTVRHQGFWDRWLPELRESLAHLFGLI